jgi:glyoxylate reductase
VKVLITREIPQAGLKVLEIYKDRIEIDYRQGPPLSKPELKKAIKEVDAIVPVIPDEIDKDVIDSAEKLKIIATYSVGYDHIDVKEATARGIFVGNTPGNLTEAVAEHSVALMMTLGRKTAEADRFCRAGKFKYWEPMKFIGPKFMGKTLGLIGFGRIGQHFARIARYGFNMRILYFDPIPHPEAESLLDAERVDLDTLLGNSDIVSIHCNLTEESKGMIGEQELKKMKPLAYLINTARGPIVNEESLVNALKEEWIAGAGLDVFEEEPKINPELIKMDNVVLSPHIASATWEARIQMSRMVAENVVDVLINNKPPRYLVNKDLAQNSVTSLS